MSQIFISYSRADRQFVDQFVPLIRRVYGNDSLWFDEDIHGGVDWWQMILDEIGKCELFIYLISNESLESPYCQAEMREALRLNKSILPVIVRRLSPGYPGNIEADLGQILRRTQYVDMSGGFRDPGTIADLYAAVTHLLNSKPHPLITISTFPTPQPSVPDKKKTAPTLRVTYIAGGFAVVATVIAAVFGLWQVIANGRANIPTLTSTTTMTLTSDPLDVALNAARNFNGSNADWQALYPDGFQHSFGDGVPMVLVPVGSFTIGANPKKEDERNGGLIRFNAPFWIDQTEITQADFERLNGVKANGNSFEGDQRPVENITWFEARDFCALRGARLPTEAEWEYAARGPAEWEYPWGDTWNENNAVGNSSSTADVGSIPAGLSWVGAFDLSGNVWEWVSSLYLPYNSQENREADTGDRSRRVLRGGSWYFVSIDILRVASREGNIPDNWDDGLGFRRARSS